MAARGSTTQRGRGRTTPRKPARTGGQEKPARGSGKTRAIRAESAPAAGGVGSIQALALELFIGSLAAYLAQARPLQVEEMEAMACQIGSALALLHTTLRVVHTNVNPAHVLWQPLRHRAALIDFAMSENIVAERPSHTVYGDKVYRAPELWTFRGPEDRAVLQPAIDV